MKSNQLQTVARPLFRAVLAGTLLVVSTCFVQAEPNAIQSDGINQVFSDTSSLDIQDSIAAVAPNMPDVKKYKSGRAFWSLYQKFDSTSMEAIEDWAKDYPKEASEYSRVVSAFMASTDFSTLSYTQKSIYYDIYAAWLVVRHEGN